MNVVLFKVLPIQLYKHLTHYVFHFTKYALNDFKDTFCSYVNTAWHSATIPQWSSLNTVFTLEKKMFEQPDSQFRQLNKISE